VRHNHATLLQLDGLADEWSGHSSGGRDIEVVMNVLSIAMFLVFTVAPDAGAAATPGFRSVQLQPTGGRVVMDYLGYEPGTDQVWAPGGNTGKVFVVDGRTRSVRTVEGFATAERDGRALGPSSVTFGPRTAYIGNRADGSICAVDLLSLQRGPCVTLPEAPDGIAYVAATTEIWATTPRSNSLAIVSVAGGKLNVAGRVALEGAPEGYAVSPDSTRFYTNLEDKDETLVLDTKSRRVLRTWPSGCGENGPRGLVLTPDERTLVVACTDAVETFSLGASPKRLARLEVGAGVDNIDVGGAPLHVFAAAGKAERLTRARLASDGKVDVTAVTPTSKGVRVVVVTKRGMAFAADSANGRLIVVGDSAP
jgi:DNA-binding beta-propeller fold protein YncE